MQLVVNVDKNHLIFFLIAIIVVMGIGFAVAVVPSPVGHSLTEIEGYISGDTDLQESLGKFCQSDGTGCPAGTALCICVQTYYYKGDDWTNGGVKCAPTSQWTGWSGRSNFDNWGVYYVRVALVPQNPDGSCTAPA